MNTMPGESGQSIGRDRTPDSVDLAIASFLRSLDHNRQGIEGLVDNVVEKFRNLPDRVAQMRTEVPDGHNLSLRDLVVTHTMMRPDEREKARIKNLQGQTGRQLQGAVAEIS